ncbi:MAG: hypothetical protein CMF49_03755 [Legionellales bacterium]|nr:hypothetical protein [Legionellales bacterium]|tara:strand:+ start:1408 stop:2292 length:885 start_codon:yes stop_codon:yes gene_type:complete
MDILNNFKIVYLDNNQEYAMSLIELAKKEGNKFLVYDNSHDLFDYLKKSYLFDDILNLYEDIIYSDNFDFNRAVLFLKMASHKFPDLILLDYNLDSASSQNGLGLSMAIKNNFKNTYNVLITSYASYEVGCTAQNDGYIDGFITKDDYNKNAEESNFITNKIANEIDCHCSRKINSDINYARLSELSPAPNILRIVKKLNDSLMEEYKVLQFVYIDKLGSSFGLMEDGYILILFSLKDDVNSFFESYGVIKERSLQMPIDLNQDVNDDNMLDIQGEITILDQKYFYGVKKYELI